jgi:type III pantothenate kinase
MSQCRILIDAGNTRLKWAVVEDGQWLAQGGSDYGNWSALDAQLVKGATCHIASVARAEHEQQLAALLGARGIVPIWLKAEPAFADVKNGYMIPRQLGVDRWMGLVAARRRTRDPVLVVSAGTAMTVDALSAGGEFLGGIIVAGAALMRQALRQGTAGVAETSGTWQAFPRRTADAAESGVVAALCGAVRQQHAHLSEAAGMTPRCLITGGDAGLLLPHLRLPVEHVPALVLEGIECVAGEDTSR